MNLQFTLTLSLPGMFWIESPLTTSVASAVSAHKQGFESCLLLRCARFRGIKVVSHVPTHYLYAVLHATLHQFNNISET